jgi:ketosteroid isomerase-like protein
MNKPIPLFILLFLFSVFMSCTSNQDKNIADKSKLEILETEKAFATMAKKEGIAEAFTYFAAEEAVINFNDILIKGRSNIKAHYADKKYNDVSLEWAPDFVDVSSSGDLGYTYGNYTFSKKDSTGKTEIFKGIFHTVWKKQKDGTWRFVWD